MSAPTKDTHHLCVLVHGLWGNPQHLRYVADSLREKHPEPHLHILVAKSNSGNFTYDGIELGGERLTREIEDELETLEGQGTPITKLSLVGYSLGGLVARYAIGLLYSRGLFDKIEPVNFTTFATPHLGARTPKLGFLGKLFNELGSRTLSTSGRQLFITDSFRDTGRPLLVLLAERNSIFMRGLAGFKRRTLYANIINDRSAPYYTTAVSAVDPFVDLEAIQMHYIKGYDEVILDPHRPATPLEPAQPPQGWQKFVIGSQGIIQKVPVAIMLSLLLPVGLAAFLVNSGIQSVRSSRRILLHEQGKAGISIKSYRMPLFVEEMQDAVEEMIQDSHPGQISRPRRRSSSKAQGQVQAQVDSESESSTTTLDPKDEARMGNNKEFPPLALTAAQSTIIESMNSLDFRVFPVHIHRHRHTHAAIIVRMKKKSFDEGKVVIRHWLENEFDV
ncbi:MAG: hypothetical protein M1823_001975 [Watsoniomyces obsoletus]|nr:MAG: hypothetical protein M1823_001975 [Watsoniomyces obsoletus]